MTYYLLFTISSAVLCFPCLWVPSVPFYCEPQHLPFRDVKVMRAGTAHTAHFLL